MVFRMASSRDIGESLRGMYVYARVCVCTYIKRGFMYYYIYIRTCVFVFENLYERATPLAVPRSACLPVELPMVKVWRVENGNVNVFRVNVTANTLADGDLCISRHVNPIPYHDDQGLLRSSVVHFWWLSFGIVIQTPGREHVRDDNGRIIVQSIDVHR